MPSSVGAVLADRRTEPSEIESYKSSSNAFAQTYACVLWNDESHSFEEVISQLMEATKCSRLEAKQSAERVDEHVSI